jgi:uncharacterized protein YbcV (DUF1398 family)
MNATAITQLAQSTLDGTLPFPEILGRLMQEGVESYRVDYRTCQFTFYGATGGTVSAPLQFEGLPPVGNTFYMADLRAAIHASQTQGQKFRDFCARAMQAGVQSYEVFLQGQRVLYLGRHGDQHVEWFSDAAPSGS